MANRARAPDERIGSQFKRHERVALGRRFESPREFGRKAEPRIVSGMSNNDHGGSLALALAVGSDGHGRKGRGADWTTVDLDR
jgi:hypothetical protein